MTAPLRVLIAEDHALIGEEIQSIVQEEYQVVGIVLDGQALLDEAVGQRPDLILLDINLPHIKGMQAAKLLKQKLPKAQLLFVTQHSAPEYLQAAFRAGAHGYVSKGRIYSDLLPALRQVASGAYYVSPALMGRDVASRFNPANNPSELFGPGITSLQHAILEALQNGRKSDDIASNLGVPGATVRHEIEELFAEWNAGSEQELVCYGMGAGLLPR